MLIKTQNKKHMTFATRRSAERAEARLLRQGYTVHCLDFDDDWFIVYSEPKTDK